MKIDLQDTEVGGFNYEFLRAISYEASGCIFVVSPCWSSRNPLWGSCRATLFLVAKANAPRWLQWGDSTHRARRYITGLGRWRRSV